MSRYKLTIEYDGTPFVGWQRQNTGLSVQQVVEDAFLLFSQESVTLFGSGRTDAGVHALGQVAHADLQKETTPSQVMRALNFYLKDRPVSILACERVSEDFHARFSARKRIYVYKILNRPAKPALEGNRVWWVPQLLDEEAMREGAGHLIGHHDFSTFRASECQALSPLKTVSCVDVKRVGERIEIRVEAKSFLHHQVRNMVGTLKRVGEGKWTPDRVQTALHAKDRAQGGPTAPASGLYFVSVLY